MSIFTAHFDESDCGSASIVAGFIGEAPQLNHFDRDIVGQFEKSDRPRAVIQFSP